MGKCVECNGAGMIDNNKYWNTKAKYQSDYYLRYDPMIKCKTCKGTGYVLSEVKDAIDLLRVYKNNPPCIGSKEFKLAIEILEKLFDEPSLLFPTNPKK